MTADSKPDPPRVITDLWHELGIGEARLSEVIGPTWWRRIKDRRLLRAFVLSVYGRRFDLVVTGGAGRPPRLIAASRLLTGPTKRKIVFVEFIPQSKPTWYGRHMERVTFALLRRVTLGVHVMTPWEQASFATRLRLPVAAVALIPHAAMTTEAGEGSLTPNDLRAGVFSSGRAACDWELLFAASEGRGWDLTVVCGARDAPRVHGLARGRADVRVLAEVTLEEHHAMLATAAVYAIPLRESNVSSGQVRLMNANSAGTAVVVTNVRGLEGYLDPGENCLATPPGDATAFGDAVDTLLADPHRRSRIVSTARSAAAAWSRDEYCRAIGQHVQRLADSRPSTQR